RRVLLDAHNAFDDHAITLGVDAEHAALLTLIATGDHLDEVALLDLRHLEHLRSERNDTHELLVTQLATHRTENTGAAGLKTIGLDNDGSILVEADVRAVGTAAFLAGTDDNGLDDLALLNIAARDCILDGGDDDVADSGVAPAGAAEHLDAEDFLCTGVNGDLEPRLLLDHELSPVVVPVLLRAWPNGWVVGEDYLAFSMTSTTR